MNRALIVLGGEAPGAAFLRELSASCDYVLCADHGLDAALAAGIRIDGVIGDFDSAKPTSVDYMKAQHIPHIVYPSIKDDTDGMACVRFILEKKPTEVVLTGASGGRFDHYLANFQLLMYLEKHGVHACISEESMTGWAVNGEKTIVGTPGDLLSVLQLSDRLIVSETGLFYPLDHHEFELGYPLGVSNVLTERVANVTVHEGWAIVLHYPAKK